MSHPPLEFRRVDEYGRVHDDDGQTIGYALPLRKRVDGGGNVYYEEGVLVTDERVLVLDELEVLGARARAARPIGTTITDSSSPPGYPTDSDTDGSMGSPPPPYAHARNSQ